MANFQPNGLPLCSFKANGDAYEHSHGDHPDYKFPVEIEFTGDITESDQSDYEMIFGSPPASDQDVRDYLKETHALIYTDGHMAVTIYECCYAMWSLKKGSYIGGRYNNKNHKLTQESLEKISKAYYGT